MIKFVKYHAIICMMLLSAVSFAQESEQLYPDTILQRLIKDKQVKQVDIIDATNKERILQSTYYDANGEEVLLKNFQNGHSYFQLFENGKLRKKLIYSTTDINDTLKAQDKYIHWFDESGNLTREDNIMEGKLFQTTEHKVSYSGDTCLFTEKKSDGRISSIRVIKKGNMEWTDYISYNNYERISEVQSFYQKYNNHHQLIEEGNRSYNKTIEEYHKLDGSEYLTTDSVSRIILFGKLEPDDYMWQKRYHYTNHLLDSIQEDMLTVKYITYNAKQLPVEVRCLYTFEDNSTGDCGKIKYLYNDLNLPTTVITYDGEGKEQSKIVYRYAF